MSAQIWGRGRSARVGIALAIGAVGLAVIGAGCGESASGSATVTETVAAADAATAEAQQSVSSDAPTPQHLSGSGKRVVSMKVSTSSPVVMRGTNSGTSNFAVWVLGDGGEELAFNEIGPYTGTTLITGLSTGRHRVKVEAEGSWTLDVTQPTPPANATPIPGTISGKGQKVVWVRADEDLQPIITGRHRGESNFAVHIVSADGEGSELLFNEIGVFSGETTTDIPAGAYLINVQADGSWTLRFAR